MPSSASYSSAGRGGASDGASGLFGQRDSGSLMSQHRRGFGRFAARRNAVSEVRDTVCTMHWQAFI